MAGKELSSTEQAKPARYRGASETARIRREGTGEILVTYSELSEIRSKTVHCNDPDELRSAVREYLSFCREKEIFPNIEGLCVFCHFSRRWFYEYLKDHPDTESAEILERFRNICIATKTSGNERGIVSDASLIFWLKNVGAGYSDRVEIIPPPAQSPLSALDAEEARKRLMELVPDEE